MNHYFTNSDILSNLQKRYAEIRNKKFVFYTDNGVFSKRGLDFGSRTLLEAVIDFGVCGKVLDVGCGYGMIGIVLSSFFPDVSVDMVDVNKRAIHLSKMNIKENMVDNVCVFESDVFSGISDKYDLIITNPPIRTGKDVVYKILFGAKEYLNAGGSLIFVVNKDQGAKSIMRDLEKVATVSILKKNKGFFVINCIFD